MTKIRNDFITPQLLAERATRSVQAGFAKQKWIKFCETLLDSGYNLKLYEAVRTHSKYITVIRDSKEFKVRFSNHKPIQERELRGDCDFFVGITHTGWRTTDDALIAVDKHFNQCPHEPKKLDETVVTAGKIETLCELCGEIRDVDWQEAHHYGYDADEVYRSHKQELSMRGYDGTDRDDTGTETDRSGCEGVGLQGYAPIAGQYQRDIANVH